MVDFSFALTLEFISLFPDDPEFLYGVIVGLDGLIISNAPDLGEENRAPKPNLDNLRKDSVHELETNAMRMKPIFEVNSSNVVSNTYFSQNQQLGSL